MTKKKSSYYYKSGTSSGDKGLMLLAAAAAIVVGFFAIFSYKSKSIAMLPSPTPMVFGVKLDAQNKSGETGMATLREENGKVIVTLALSGYPAEVTQPAHIHVGSCPNPGAVKYPLNPPLNGQSTTTLNVTLDELKTMGALALNVHKSSSASNIYYACGNLSF